MDKFAIELPRFVIALSLVLAVLALAALLCGLVLLRRAAAPSVDGETDISSVYDSLHGAESRLKTAELARGLMGLVCSGVVLGVQDAIDQATVKIGSAASRISSASFGQPSPMSQFRSTVSILSLQSTPDTEIIQFPFE